MSDENKLLAKQCSQLHFTCSQTAALLALRDEVGLTWNVHHVMYLSWVDQNSRQFFPQVPCLRIVLSHLLTRGMMSAIA
jgi:hypothetical protein